MTQETDMVRQAIAQAGAHARLVTDEDDQILYIEAVTPRYESPKQNRFYLMQSPKQTTVEELAMEIKRWWDRYDNLEKE